MPRSPRRARRLDRGVWTFGTSQQPPVYISGAAYDIYGAAVDALYQLLAKERAAIDSDADGRRSSAASVPSTSKVS